jgi:YHS domain-containing protein
MGVFRWVAIVILFYLIYRVLRSLFLPGTSNSGDDALGRPVRPSANGAEELVADPECGIYLPRKEALEAWVGGRTEFFCSAACRDRYIERNIKP